MTYRILDDLCDVLGDFDLADAKCPNCGAALEEVPVLPEEAERLPDCEFYCICTAGCGSTLYGITTDADDVADGALWYEGSVTVTETATAVAVIGEDGELEVMP